MVLRCYTIESVFDGGCFQILQSGILWKLMLERLRFWYSFLTIFFGRPSGLLEDSIQALGKKGKRPNLAAVRTWLSHLRLTLGNKFQKSYIKYIHNISKYFDLDNIEDILYIIRKRILYRHIFNTIINI